MRTDTVQLPDTFPFNQQIAWQPTRADIEGSNLHEFMRRHDITDLDTLIKRSTDDIAWFWNAVFEDLDIRFRRPYERVVDLTGGIQMPAWCVDGEMNIIDNCLDKWIEEGKGDRPALRWEGEEGTVRVLSYAELNRDVGRCAAALRASGVRKGDAVGLFMPMTVELAVAFLASIKVGAIILPLFSGYGASAVATRLNDAGAKVLFTADGFFRRGKTVSMKTVADEALHSVPSVTQVIVQRRVGFDVEMTPGRDVYWDDFVRDMPDTSPTEPTSAEDVLMIIYTSGTTGRPKGAIHTHCGFPVKAAQDIRHCMDLKEGEVLYWMTDMGWMMGPWLVFGSLLLGASMVFTDGAPDHPGVDRLWSIVDRHQVTHLGVSPTLIRSLKGHGTEPLKGHDLSRLRAVGSTGSPWDPGSWTWLFENVLDSRKPILNYSGGTEISGGILCGNFLRPLKPCAFSGPVPGMDVDVVDEQGMPVRGEVGELVIRKPWIGMTRGFWNDNQRFLDTYWSRFENVWVHGDFAAVDEDGLWYILGRSDDTLKVAGKRLGPSEVESLVNAHPDVSESAAVGVPHDIKGEDVVVFCVLRQGAEPTEALRKDLMALVVDGLGKAMKPQAILFSSALPKTRNSKVMRRVIRAAHLGNDPGDVTSLEDPTTVDAIRHSM
jgi:acetyl-CoA synthetase